MALAGPAHNRTASSGKMKSALFMASILGGKTGLVNVRRRRPVYCPAAAVRDVVVR